MDTSDYKKAIDSAYAETRELLVQRAGIDARLSQLKLTIEALSSLLKNTPEFDPASMAVIEGMLGHSRGEYGITDAIRQLLQRAKVPLTPVEIRDSLNKEGFDINSYASGLTVIHNTLKRLEKQGEVTVVRNPSGNVVAYTIFRETDIERVLRQGQEALDRSREIMGSVLPPPGVASSKK